MDDARTAHERALFERWVIADARERGYGKVRPDADFVRRDADGTYNPVGREEVWRAWLARASITGLTPMGWVIDAATEGELAAYDDGCNGMMASLKRILDGEDKGAGVANEPWESLRRRVIALVAARGVMAVVPDERAAFEVRFPKPDAVIWDGSEYEVREGWENSYRIDRFLGQWEAWKAARGVLASREAVLREVRAAGRLPRCRRARSKKRFGRAGSRSRDSSPAGASGGSLRRCSSGRAPGRCPTKRHHPTRALGSRGARQVFQPRIKAREPVQALAIVLVPVVDADDARQHMPEHQARVLGQNQVLASL